MAIALTPFLAFLNFLPLPAISAHLAGVPELADIVPPSLASSLSSLSADPSSSDAKQVLQEVFGKFMTLPTATVSGIISRILARFDSGDVKETERGQGFVDLVRMLNEQYPEDVGVLCVYLLNVVELKKGEAAFLGANMPHAYISGGMFMSLFGYTQSGWRCSCFLGWAVSEGAV